MLNVSEISGFDMYSDLYKDVYGSRPRNCNFETVEEFEKDFDFLMTLHDRKMEEDRRAQEQAIARFEISVSEIMLLCNTTDRENAIRIIMDAEGRADDFEFYGYESLEWALNLPYGYIKGTL